MSDKRTPPRPVWNDQLEEELAHAVATALHEWLQLKKTG